MKAALLRRISYTGCCTDPEDAVFMLSEREAEAAAIECTSLDSEFISAEPIFEAVASGDVLLLSGKWLLARAGYTWHPIPQGHDNKRLQKTKGHTIQPLPNRQQLEAEEPEAAIGSESLRSSYSRFRRVVAGAVNRFDGRRAMDDQVDCLPVIVISHVRTHAWGSLTLSG